MYQFAIDMGEETSYTPAAPKGAKSPRSSLINESNWKLPDFYGVSDQNWVNG
jgi:hypothetical protein